MANEGKASIEIVGDVSNFARQVERDLNEALKRIKLDPVKVDIDQRHLAEQGREAGKEIASEITQGIDGGMRNNPGLKQAGAVTGATVGTAAGNSAGKTFGQRFKTALNKSGGFGKGLLAKLGPVLKDGLSSVLSGGLQAAGKAVGAAGTVLGGTLIASLAAVVGPGLVSTVGAAVTAALGVGLGAGLVGLGAVFLRESKPLREAAKGVVKTLNDIGKKAAQPLLKPLTTALRDTSELIRQLRPEFTSIFKQLAPSIAPLNAAIGRFVGSLTRGIRDSMPGITAALAGFGRGLETIGENLGDFFRTIFANDKLIDNATEGILGLIGSALKPLGSLVSGLTVIFAAWRNLLILFSGTYLPQITEAIFNFVDSGTGALGRISEAWGPLGDAIQNVWNKIKDFAGEDNEKLLAEKFAAIVQAIKDTWAPLKEYLSVIWTEIVAFIRRKWEEEFVPWWEGTAKPWLQQAIRSAFETAWAAAVSIVSDKITQIRSRIQAGMAAVPGIIIRATAAIPGIIRSALASAALSAAAGALAIANGIRQRLLQLPAAIRSILSGVRNAVLGAFAGAAGWLRSAGSQIISGLISGLQSGFGRVRSTLGALTAMLPSWKGPEQVDRRILYKSGEMVMQGFQRGILDSKRSIASTLGAVTGDLASFAAPTGQRGYGSTTMTGGITFNVNVAGATGQQAGQRAAEQILKQLAAAGLAR